MSGLPVSFVLGLTWATFIGAAGVVMLLAYRREGQTERERSDD